MHYLDTAFIKLSNRLSLLADIDLNAIADGESDGGALSQVVTGVKDVGQDSYTLLMWVGGFGSIIILILAAIGFVISGQSNKRQEAKSWIVTAIIGAIIIFASIFIINLAKTVGVNLSGAGK